MLRIEEYTWAFRVIGTRSFGKFMPYITLFPVGELLNHDNAETYYIYQYPHEVPDASTRYSGIVDEHDHDDDLILKDVIVSMTCVRLYNINREINAPGADRSNENEKMQTIKDKCSKIDTEEGDAAREHKKYRPPDMDLTENDEKIASICAGPNEHYLPGSEVYMSYGRYSNRQLLSTYGFALKENYYNYAMIKLNLKVLFDNQDGTVMSEAIGKTEASCMFKMKKKIICKEFLRALRGIYWKENYPTDAFLDPVFPELELRVLNNATRILNVVVGNYPTTLEEDLGLLSQEIPLRKYFAVLYRSQVKDIIKQQMKYVEIAKAVVQRLLDGSSFEDSKKIVESEESAECKVYLGYEFNRKALSSYLQYLGNSSQ